MQSTNSEAMSRRRPSSAPGHTRPGRRRRSFGVRLLCAPLFPLLALAGCNGDDDEVVVVTSRGVVIGDFQSIADYLADPTVQLILQNMPRHQGSSPPDVLGEYTAGGELVATSIPGTAIGDDFGPFFFCIGSPAGASVEIQVFDPSIDAADARSFIEGSGDAFTAYTAFRSTQFPEVGAGSLCEIHQVVIFSGRREADGSLSDLFIGQGVVGLVGDCDPLIVGDVQVAAGAAERTGDGCPAVPGGAEGLVELVVDNALVNPIVVFVDYEGFLGPQPFVVFPDEVSQPMFVDPGFFLSFESLQPSRPDIDGNDVLMGVVLAGLFEQDVTPPGGGVTFEITNQVGPEEYFAPFPLNRTEADIITIVNTNPAVASLLDLLGPGQGCLCPLPPSPEPYNIGYYPYSIPDFISPAETNVRFFIVPGEAEIPGASGPFDLAPRSGAVIIQTAAAVRPEVE